MSFWGYREYLPVAQRRANAAKEVAKLKKQGCAVSPVVIEGPRSPRAFGARPGATTSSAIPTSPIACRAGALMSATAPSSTCRSRAARSRRWSAARRFIGSRSTSRSRRRRAGRRSARTAPARSAPSSSSCKAGFRSTSWRASAAKPTACSRRRKRSRCRAPVPTGRACASTWRRRSTASAPNSTMNPISCSLCAGSIAASSSPPGRIFRSPKRRPAASAGSLATTSPRCSAWSSKPRLPLARSSRIKRQRLNGRPPRRNRKSPHLFRRASREAARRRRPASLGGRPRGNPLQSRTAPPRRRKPTPALTPFPRP